MKSFKGTKKDVHNKSQFLLADKSKKNPTVQSVTIYEVLHKFWLNQEEKMIQQLFFIELNFD